MSGESVFVCLL